MKKIAVVVAIILVYTSLLLLMANGGIPVIVSRASGTSMYPAIHNGDAVFILKGAEFGVGDIIAFKWGDMTVAHRVTGIYADGRVVETKGDNVSYSDGFVFREDILGKVVLVLPYWAVYLPHVVLTILGIAVARRLEE